MNRPILALSLLFLPAVTAAQDAPQAKTTSNIQVSVDELKARLKPLKLAEVKVEVDAWTDIYQKKVQEISEQDVLRLTREGAEKTSALEAITRLRGELTEIDDRARAVIDAWRAKGAKKEDVQTVETYLNEAAGVDPGFDVEAIWALAYGWLTSATGGIRLGINIVLFLLTLFAFQVLARLAGKVMKKIVGRVKGASDLLRKFCVNFATKFTFFIGIIVALTMLGVNVGPFLAVIGAAGFIVGFALQGTLNNFAAGIMILVYRPFDVGNFVEVAGVSGKVERMTMSSTTVKTPDNQVIIIPNGSIWGGIIKNVTGSETRRVDLTFGIGYGDDIGKALEVLERTVKSHKLVLADPAPVIRVHQLGDSSVNFVVRPWAKTGNYWEVYWDLTRMVKERFDAEGISIPFPQRDVHVHQVAPGT